MKSVNVMLMALFIGMQGVSIYGGEAEAEYAAEAAKNASEAAKVAAAKQEKESWAAWTHRNTVGRAQNAARAVANAVHAHTVAPVQNAVEGWRKIISDKDIEGQTDSLLDDPTLHGVSKAGATHVVIPAFAQTSAESRSTQAAQSVPPKTHVEIPAFHSKPRSTENEFDRWEQDATRDLGTVVADVEHDVDGGERSRTIAQQSARENIPASVPAVQPEPIAAEQLTSVSWWTSVVGVTKSFAQALTSVIPSLSFAVVPDAGGINLGEIGDVDNDLAMGGDRNVAHFESQEARQHAFAALAKIDDTTLAKLTQTKALLDSWTGTLLRAPLSLIIPTMPQMDALLDEMITTQRVPVDIDVRLQTIIAGIPGGARLAALSGSVAGSALRGESSAAMLDAAAKALPQLLPLVDVVHDLTLLKALDIDNITDIRKVNQEALKSSIMQKLVDSVKSVVSSKDSAVERTAKISAIVKQIALILFGIALTSVIVMGISDVTDHKQISQIMQYVLLIDIIAVVGGITYGSARVASLTNKQPAAPEDKGGQEPVAEEPVEGVPVAEGMSAEPAVVV